MILTLYVYFTELNNHTYISEENWDKRLREREKKYSTERLFIHSKTPKTNQINVKLVYIFLDL